jgi:hypothetical protein
MKVNLPIVSAILLALPLVGCQSKTSTTNRYDNVEMQQFTTTPGADTYRVFDKPSEGRLMIASNVGTAATLGITQGLTFGLAGSGGLATKVRGAAQQYLDSTGRNCAIYSVEPIADPKYEVLYTCNAPAG